MVLAVALAGASVVLGMNWQKQSLAAAAQVPALSEQLAKARAEHATLSQQLKPGTPAVALDEALSGFLAKLSSEAPVRRVVLAAAPSKDALVKDAADESGLASTKLTVSGRFEAYPELVSYLQTLQQGPQALVRLTVEGNAFEASFRVFGLAS